MKNLLHISEQEKKNILRMHGIKNEENLNQTIKEQDSWGDITLGLRADEINPMLEIFTGKPIDEETKGEIIIPVWISGCSEKSKICKNFKKCSIHINMRPVKDELLQEPGKPAKQLRFASYKLQEGNDSKLFNIHDFDFKLATYAKPPRIKIEVKYSDKSDFINIFNSEQDARAYQDQRIKEGWKDDRAMVSNPK